SAEAEPSPIALACGRPRDDVSRIGRAYLHSEYSRSIMEGKMANIGYARVSSDGQDFNGQIDKLKAAGCKQLFSEKASAKSTNGRHALQKALDALKPGDTLIVVRLDRLARSIRDLLGLLDEIKAAGAHIKALEDPWLDTTTPHGELILTIMGGMAEFARKLIRARCDEGIQ